MYKYFIKKISSLTYQASGKKCMSLYNNLDISLIFLKKPFVFCNIAQSKPFKGELAVITGGTRGIGFSIAQKFAQNGARCVLIGRNKEIIEKSRNYLDKNFEV